MVVFFFLVRPPIIWSCVPTPDGDQRVHLNVLEQNEYTVVFPTATTFFIAVPASEMDPCNCIMTIMKMIIIRCV